MNKENRRVPNDQELEAASRIRDVWLKNKKRLGLSQDRAAEALGWSQGVFNGYINGKRPLTVQAVLRFAKLLEVSAVELAPEIVNANESDVLGIEKISNTGLPVKSQLEIKNIVETLVGLPPMEIEYAWKIIQLRKKFLEQNITSEYFTPEGNPVAGETTIVSNPNSKKKAV